MEVSGFVAEDWKRIPQNNRYLILSGSLLLAIDWLADHWGKGTIYNLWGFDFRQLFFSVGVTLILLGLLAIIFKQFIALSLLTHYRTIYSMDKGYDLVRQKESVKKRGLPRGQCQHRI